MTGLGPTAGQQRRRKPSRADSTASLDPDVLGELEREREFLLRSLDDLDAEHQAGDLDPTDYHGLADDYTRRLAEVARSISEERAAFKQVDNRLSNRQRLLTLLAVLVVAGLAGVLLARASGFRTPEGSTTGDIRRSSAGLLSEADTLTREGEWPEAIERYNRALDLSPANVEALTYRGWLTARLGDPEAGLVDLSEAVALDDSFPDALVFSAILLDDEQRFDEAAERIARLDELEVPDEMLGLINASELRASVAAGQIKQRFGDLAPGDALDLSQVTATLDDVARAGALFWGLGDATMAFASFEAVLEEDPDQIIALIGKGQLAREAELASLSPELVIESLAALDDAVRLEPDNDVIRLYRSDARAVQGDLDGARADLTSVDPEGLSADLLALYENLTALLN